SSGVVECWRNGVISALDDDRAQRAAPPGLFEKAWQSRRLVQQSAGMKLRFSVILAAILPLVLAIPLGFAQDELPRAAQASLTADFAQRDRLPETSIARSQWYLEKLKGTWGPRA